MGLVTKLKRENHLKSLEASWVIIQRNLKRNKMASEEQNQVANPSSDVSDEEKEKDEETVDLRILDPDTIELDLNHGRIGKIENLEPLTQLESLYLRWNMIKNIENLSNLGATLRELELYDNQISKLENLDSLVNLEILDVSQIQGFQL